MARAASVLTTTGCLREELAIGDGINRAHQRVLRHILLALWLLVGCGLSGCGEPAAAGAGAPVAAATANDRPLWKSVALPAEAAGKTLRSICFVDDQRGWIVGDGGLCLTTADAGQTWTVVATGSDAVFRQVRFNDAEHGFICGDGDSEAPNATGHVVIGLRPLKSGLLLVTTDGGKTWQKKWLPCNFEIYCVETSAAPTLQVGIGCPKHMDGDITRSNDGGDRWKERRIYRALCDIRAVDANRWIAVGSPVSVSFTGGVINNPAYLAKACRAVFSGDGGKTWAPAQGADGKDCLRALLVKKDLPILAVGDRGAILRTDDFGASWTAIDAPQDQHLRAIAATAPVDGRSAIVAVGRYGRFLLSSDGGKSWRASWTGQSNYLNGVAVCGGVFWCVGADGSLLRAEAQALIDAPTLPAAPAPVKPAAKPPEPVKTPTAAQRERLHVGDFAVYTLRQQAAAVGLNTQCRIKRTITAIDGDRFTLLNEVLEGTPPPGTPPRWEEKHAIADVEDYSDLAVGATRTEKSAGASYTTQRKPDEALTVKDTKLDCVRTGSEAELPNGAGHHLFEQWLCGATVPVFGVVKSVSRQTLPGGQEQQIVRTEELVDWGRAEPKPEPPAAPPTAGDEG